MVIVQFLHENMQKLHIVVFILKIIIFADHPIKKFAL